MIPTSPKEALEFGFSTYFSGTLCKYGHMCERNAHSRACIMCLAINSKNCRERNIDKFNEKERNQRLKRKDKILKYSRDRYKTNREDIRKATEKWRIKNKHKDAAKTTRYKAQKLNACPSWVNLKDIEWFYLEARRLTLETGIPHEVDHIHPLQGENVCGLHVPWNLQILTKSENSSKKNKMIDAALKE